MWSYLRSHPDIFMSRQKELYFFSADLRARQISAPTLEDYLRHFAAASGQKMVGEATPDYLRSQVAPKAIRAYSPTAKVIIMLRNPTDVMYSLHSGALCLREPIVDFEAALDADTRRTGQQLVGYRQFTDYPDQVQRYLGVFGRDNVQIIIFDDLRENPAHVYQDTLRFLGVDPSFMPKFEVESANERVRSKRLERILFYPPRSLRLIGRGLVPRRLRPQIRQALVNSNRAKKARPPMDPQLRRRLQKEFEPKVEQLSRLLDRDLSRWCND